ncbi:MAG: hypothetical protein JWM78_3169 [Verrucomicrobiaceae bacterium]|nr:hypothetical protein [Verrucomicrobiaceae bacterium]
MKKLIIQGSLAFAFAVWVVLNWPALIALHLRWIIVDESYSIGYPVVAIALWLIFESRKSLLNIPIRPSLLAIGLFLLASTASLAAQLVQLQLLQQLMVPISLWLLIVAVAGWRFGRVLLFPFLLIYIAIPLWDVLVDPLRMVTVIVTQSVLHVAKIPAFVLGYQITLPDGIIMVADGCSGLNLLLSAVVVGALQFHLMVQPFWRRAAVATLAVMLGLIDNWIRVVAIVLVGHFSHMQSALVYHHGNFGWIVFAISLVPFFMAVRWLDHGDYVKPVDISISSSPALSAHTASYAAIAAAGGIALLALTLFIAQRERSATVLIAPAQAIPAQAMWLPQYEGYDQQQHWRVSVDAASFDISVLTYLHQTDTKKLIYFSNRIADEQHTLSVATVAVSDSLRINQTVIDAGGPRMVWWFYLIDSHVVTGGLAAKWHQLMELLRGNAGASLVTISTRCTSSSCSEFLSDDDVATPAVRGLLISWFTKLNIASR